MLRGLNFTEMRSSTAVRREHIAKRINEAEATSVERALAMWLEIGQPR
jgi:hypothetical protein